MAVPIIPYIVMIGGVAVKYATKKLAESAAKNIGGRILKNPSQKIIDKALSPKKALKNNPTLKEKIKAQIGIPPKQTKTMPFPGKIDQKAGIAVGKLSQTAYKRQKQIKALLTQFGLTTATLGLTKSSDTRKGIKDSEASPQDTKKKVASKTPPKTPPKKPKDLIDRMAEEAKQDKKKPKQLFMKEGKTGKDSKVEFKATTGNTGLLASKKDLKPVPAGKKGKGLSMLDKSVRNNMGFMYGGGMPMPSKKPRMSTTDYRKASKGMLIISIDMKKKKGKGKKA